MRIRLLCLTIYILYRLDWERLPGGRLSTSFTLTSTPRHRKAQVGKVNCPWWFIGSYRLIGYTIWDGLLGNNFKVIVDE